MKKYFYSDGQEKFGPFTMEELRTKGLNATTLIWYEGLTDWQPASDLEEFVDFFTSDQVSVNPPEISTSTVPPPTPVQTNQAKPLSAPKSWLVESILVTIFCCLPFGIVGIINAAKVDSKYSSGDYEGALKASKDAGTWVKLSFWIGLGIVIIYSIMVFAGIIAGVDF